MAQTQLYRKIAQIHLVEETTQDTYLAPAGSGAGIFLAEIPEVPMTIQTENYRQTTVTGNFLSQDEIPGAGGISAQITCRVPLKGSGTAGTAPEFGEALKACGMEETTVAVTSVTYNPLSTFDGAGGNPGPSYSVSVLENGNRWAIKGAFGNLVIVGNLGEPMFAEMTFTGSFVAVAADALETVTYQTTTPPSFRGASFAVNHGSSYVPKGVRNFTLDIGNTVVPFGDINDAAGIYGARITDRQSFGSFDPEMVVPATHDYFGIWTAGTSGTITTGVVGSTAGNRVRVNVNRCVRRPIALGNRDGVRILTVPFAVSSAPNAVEGTNLDIELIFT